MEKLLSGHLPDLCYLYVDPFCLPPSELSPLLQYGLVKGDVGGAQGRHDSRKCDTATERPDVSRPPREVGAVAHSSNSLIHSAGAEPAIDPYRAHHSPEWFQHQETKPAQVDQPELTDLVW